MAIGTNGAIHFRGRYEHWRAFDSVNVTGATKITQTVTDASRFSPRPVLAWSPTPRLSLTASAAKASRFATTSELFQLASTDATFTSPNPDLKPDNVFSTELRAENMFDHARVQLELFNGDIQVAIIAQFKPLVAGSTTLYSFLSNVDHARPVAPNFRCVQWDWASRNWILPEA